MSNSVNDRCERRFIRGRPRTWIDSRGTFRMNLMTNLNRDNV